MPITHHKRRAAVGVLQPNLVYVGGNSGAGNDANPVIALNALTGGIASAAAAGDLVIGAIVWVSATARSLSGFDATMVSVTAAGFGGGNTLQLRAARKRLSAADASISFLMSGSQNYAYMVQVWRNSHASTPEDAAVTTGTNTGSSIPDAPSITTVTNATMVIAVGAMLDVTNGDPAISAPSDMTNFVHATPLAGNHAELAMTSADMLAAGAFDPPPFGGGAVGATRSWIAATIAIRPA